MNKKNQMHTNPTQLKVETRLLCNIKLFFLRTFHLDDSAVKKQEKIPLLGSPKFIESKSCDEFHYFFMTLIVIQWYCIFRNKFYVQISLLGFHGYSFYPNGQLSKMIQYYWSFDKQRYIAHHSDTMTVVLPRSSTGFYKFI